MPANYAELLLAEGWADARLLHGLVISWSTLLERLGIQLALLDHAPTALLACRLAGIPVLNLGNGFATPPASTPTPSMRPWEQIPDSRLMAADARVNKQIARIARAQGAHSDVTLQALLCGPSLLTCFPELDHYPDRDEGAYAGPLYGLPRAKYVAWLGAANTRVLAYLRPDVPGFAQAMAALQQCGAEVVARVPGLAPAAAQAMAGPRLRIALGAIDFAALLPEAHAVVSYGGSGLVSETLVAGVPQLLLAKHVEQYLLALRLVRLGCGIAAREDRTAAALQRFLTQLLEDGAHAHAARTLAQRHAGYAPDHAVNTIKHAAEAMVS